MLTHRTFVLTSLGPAVAAILAAYLSRSKDEVTEGSKMVLTAPDAGKAAAEALPKAVEAFTKETKAETDVKPVFDVSQELARGITAGPGIDVVVLDLVQLSSHAGVLHSWDKGAAAIKDASPALLTSTTRQEKIAAASRDVSTFALYVNTSLWPAAGLDESDYLTIWEQLDQVAAKLASDDVIGLTLDTSHTRVGAFLVQDGEGLINADSTKATTSSEDSVAGLAQVKTLLSSGSAGWGADLPAGPVADAFGQGQAAMVIETEALAKTLAGACSGIPYKVVELPAGNDGKGTSQFPTFYGVVEASKHKADTIKFVEYLTATERRVVPAGAAGTVPADKSVGDTWKGKHADQAVFLAGAEYPQPAPSASGTSDVIATFDNEPPGPTRGDPAAVLDSIQVSLQTALS